VYSRVVIVSYRRPLEHPAAPERSPDQRMAALSIANEIRTFRTQLKHDLKAGRASIAPLLLASPVVTRLKASDGRARMRGS
jgi:hypothetical protein